MSGLQQDLIERIFLKEQIQNLYHDYALALDQDNLNQWLTFLLSHACIELFLARIMS